LEPEAELLEPVRGLGPPGQRTVHATAGRSAAAAAASALGRTVCRGTVTDGGRGRGHGAPVPHRRHGRGQRQLELGKVGAPVTQRAGGHARVVGTGRVPVVLARHARRPADVHQSGLLVVRGHAAVGRGGRGGRAAAGRRRGTFARDLTGHALGRRRVIRTTGDGAPAGTVLHRRVVVVAPRRVRRTGPSPMLRVGRSGVFPIVAVGRRRRRRRRRFVLVQARYARRLFGQAPVHYVLQHVLLLAVAVAAVAVAVGRRTHGQVTGKQVALGFHHTTVDRFHGHVVALFVGSATAAAATTLLITALVARVGQTGFGQHVFGVFVVAKRFAKLQVHVVRVRRRFSAVLGRRRRRLLLFTVDAGRFQVHVVTRGRGRHRFRVLLFLRNVHGRVNRSVGLGIVLQKSNHRLSRRKYLS